MQSHSTIASATTDENSVRVYSLLLEPALWKIGCTPPTGLIKDTEKELLLSLTHHPKSKAAFDEIITEFLEILKHLYYVITIRDPNELKEFLPHIALTVIHEAINQSPIKGKIESVKGHHLKCLEMRNKINNFQDSIGKFLSRNAYHINGIAQEGIERMQSWKMYLDLHIKLIDRAFEILHKNWPEKAEEVEKNRPKKRKQHESVTDKPATNESVTVETIEIKTLTQPHGGTPTRTPKKMTPLMERFRDHFAPQTQDKQTVGEPIKKPKPEPSGRNLFN